MPDSIALPFCVICNFWLRKFFNLSLSQTHFLWFLPSSLTTYLCSFATFSFSYVSCKALLPQKSDLSSSIRSVSLGGWTHSLSWLELSQFFQNSHTCEPGCNTCSGSSSTDSPLSAHCLKNSRWSCHLIFPKINLVSLVLAVLSHPIFKLKVLVL